MAQPVILFIYDDIDKAAAGVPYQSEAARLGFRVVSADWKRIQSAAEGVVLLEGRQVEATGATRALASEHIRPDVLVHRKLIWGPSEDLVSQIGESDGVLCSYHPAWKLIGDKWTLESCFQMSEQDGVAVPRPRTFLVDKKNIRDALGEIGRSRPLIFKPSAASLCEGILLSSAADFDSVADQAARSNWKRYVVQELVESGPLYEGRRFDLRVYAIVTSFDPLRVEVMREGVVRLAARAFDPAAPVDPLAVLTGHKFRQRQGVSTENLSISDFLSYADSKGLEAATFWSEVESLLKTVFTAIHRSGLMPHADELRGRFYLAGTDLLMAASKGTYSLLFLETNYVPDLVGWGPGVDLQLRAAYRQWLEVIQSSLGQRLHARLRHRGSGKWPRFT